MNPRWKYQDGRGVWQEGEFVRCFDYGGTDVTYQFKQDNGTIDMVSGTRLQAANRIWPKQEAHETA